MSFFGNFGVTYVRCGRKMTKRAMKDLPTCTDCELKLKSQKEYIRTCLVDKTQMEKEVIENVVIDRCSSCGGVWLDPGKLEVN